MSQLRLLAEDAGLGTTRETAIGIPLVNRLGALPSKPQLLQQPSYVPFGPHGRVREKLMRAQTALSQDEKLSISRVSVRALESAVSAFLAELRLMPVSSRSAAPGGSRSAQGSRQPGKERLPASERIARRQDRKFREQKSLHNI